MLNKLYLKKETVALVVVFCDLAVGFLLLGLLYYLRTMQYITESEIEESSITAEDFAVQIKNLPPHANIRQLKADMWQWIESRAPD